MLLPSLRMTSTILNYVNFPHLLLERRSLTLVPEQKGSQNSKELCSIPWSASIDFSYQWASAKKLRQKAGESVRDKQMSSVSVHII